MFCLFKKKPRKRKAQPKPQHPAAPTRRVRTTVGEVYAMVMDAKNALDSIPDIELVTAKRAMNTLEDLLWQSVNSVNHTNKRGETRCQTISN